MFITSPDRIAIFTFALLVVGVYGWSGLSERCWRPEAISRIAVAFVAAVIAALVAFGMAAPVVTYALLCLALVSVFAFDLLQEEHERRRRVASLASRPAADVIPTVWIACAAVSPVMLVPYVLGEQRAAALIVGVCALAMALIAWRIASAPIQLEGGDIRSERARDRARRSQRAGSTAVLAVGSIFVFVTFVNAALPVVTPLQRLLMPASLSLWAVLLAWQMWYVRHLARLACIASS